MAHQNKKDTAKGLFCFGILIKRDSNPERAFCVKKKLPVASFLTKWYADGYQNALAFGSASEKYAKRIVPDGAPT